jgi:hypothetical protein
MNEFHNALVKFQNAASSLLEVWEPDQAGDGDAVENYPEYLPSFEEFVADVHAMIMRAHCEPKVKVGDHVQITKDIERFPHFTCPAGWTGEVTDDTNGVISVRMYRYLGPGADEWNNEVIFNANGPGMDDDFNDHCRILEG